MSPLSHCDTRWLLPQIPQDWLGLQIKHCLPIIKSISYTINEDSHLFPGYGCGTDAFSSETFSCETWKGNFVSGQKKSPLRKKEPKMGLLNSKNPKDKQAHILLLGLDSAGKSTLLYRLKLAETVTTIPTIGFNVEMVQLKGGLALTVWDVGGQEKMRAVWGGYCENAQGLAYVVDCSDGRQRLEDSRREFKHILQNEHIRNAPVVVLANKQDLPGALSAEDITRMFKVKKLCSDRNWYVQPCCALTGEGLDDGFRKLTEFVKSRLKTRDTLALFKQK